MIRHRPHHLVGSKHNIVYLMRGDSWLYYFLLLLLLCTKKQAATG